jgi:hypothetical protein
MPLPELSDLELKMLWVVTDAGLDAAFATFDQLERQAALSVFEKVYNAYRGIEKAA